MELGATVCVPNTQPKCAECPVSAACQAYAAVREYEERGGDPQAKGAPRVTDYPAKVGDWTLSKPLLCPLAYNEGRVIDYPAKTGGSSLAIALKP